MSDFKAKMHQTLLGSFTCSGPKTPELDLMGLLLRVKWEGKRGDERSCRGEEGKEEYCGVQKCLK